MDELFLSEKKVIGIIVFDRNNPPIGIGIRLIPIRCLLGKLW
jgi:hypothetical protein